MKRLFTALLAALLLPACALAEGFTLEEDRILAGMNQSWRQGYEPTVDGNSVNIYLPLTSDKTGGKITATLALDDPTTSPFATTTLTADCWKNEGLYAVRLRLPLVSARHNGDYAARVVVANAATNAAVKAWLDAHGATEAGAAAIAAFDGGEPALQLCYLVDSPPESNPEVEVEIPSIGFDANGNPVLAHRVAALVIVQVVHGVSPLAFNGAHSTREAPAAQARAARVWPNFVPRPRRGLRLFDHSSFRFFRISG